MENQSYKPAHYTVEIELEKSSGEVFNHLINLNEWWPEDFAGADIKLNSEFIFTSGDSHYSKNKVTEFVQNKKIVWLTTESIRTTDNFDWKGTKMIFELAPNGNSTMLRFTYDGVVLENDSDRLAMICDMTVKELFYNFIVNGKGK